MDRKRKTYTEFVEQDIQSFAVPMKVGLLATLNEEGLPHLTLITTLQAGAPQQVIWGQFTEGLSKSYVRHNPKIGFLIMTLDKNLWRGKAQWTHIERSGPAFDMYNTMPMFRYNAYFGVHSVHCADLVVQYGREALPMRSVVMAAVKTVIAKRLSKNRANPQVLNSWTRQLLDRMSNLKFLAYVDRDGYPHIIPIIQAQTLDSQHVIFPTSVYGDELKAISEGVTVAIFGMSLDMEDVLLRGVFQGVQRTMGLQCGTVRVNWVYNSMPPVPGQIYPKAGVEPVTTFQR
jgi:general stress protein 26